MVTIDDIEKYRKEIEAAKAAEWKRMGFTHAPAPTYEMKEGKKFVKIVEVGQNGWRCVHCFVDFEGNIYKPASFNRPAKHIRGNIKNDKKPLLAGEYYMVR
jgi:hypothetical protein